MHLNTNNIRQRLVDFAATKHMVVSSTCFRHKEIHKQTRRSPDGKTNNEIEHILTDERKASNLLDVKLCRGASSDCDRFSVRGRYRCKRVYRKYEPDGTAGRLHVDGFEKRAWLVGSSCNWKGNLGS